MVEIGGVDGVTAVLEKASAILPGARLAPDRLCLQCDTLVTHKAELDQLSKAAVSAGRRAVRMVEEHREAHASEWAVLAVGGAEARLRRRWCGNRARPTRETGQGLPAFTQATGRCAQCHREETAAVVHQFERSQHSQANITCYDCHQRLDGQDALTQLGVREPQPAGAELLPEDAILLLEIVDDVTLLLVDPARDGHDKVDEHVVHPAALAVHRDANARLREHVGEVDW